MADMFTPNDYRILARLALQPYRLTPDERAIETEKLAAAIEAAVRAHLELLDGLVFP